MGERWGRDGGEGTKEEKKEEKKGMRIVHNYHLVKISPLPITSTISL
jgi:hypothetical protein